MLIDINKAAIVTDGVICGRGCTVVRLLVALIIIRLLIVLVIGLLVIRLIALLLVALLLIIGLLVTLLLLIILLGGSLRLLYLCAAVRAISLPIRDILTAKIAIHIFFLSFSLILRLFIYRSGRGILLHKFLV